MRVLVVGAGIGGLVTALALRHIGVDVHVFEQASVLREVGAGLTMGPNAVKVLHRLGLADALATVAVTPGSRDLREWQRGDLLARIPLGAAAAERWGAPYYTIHRADLHTALRTALGDRSLTLGARCVSVEQDKHSATLRFADGAHASGDLVIGADGIHSVIRGYVETEDRPNWTRQIAWRGVVSGDVGREAGLESNHHLFWGPGQLFVTYYMSAGSLINWVGGVEYDGDWREESWSARGDRDEVLRQYADWNPQVRALIAGTELIYKWALYDRPPLETWVRGRVALLGDAAHPMLPYMGQGAAQSIEDAAMLARCLQALSHDSERALQAYVASRRERAARLQVASRDACRNMQLSDPAAVAARNARMREDPATQVAANDWVWGYDIAKAPIAAASEVTT